MARSTGTLTATALALLLALCPIAQAKDGPGERTRALLESRDYARLEAHLTDLLEAGRLSGHWTTKIDEELSALGAAPEPRRLVRFANEWVKRSPRSPWPFALRAELTLQIAKEERRREGRGSESAGTWLGYARADLDHAQKQRPALSLVQTRRIEVMMLAGHPRGDAAQAVETAARIDRGDVGPALAYLTFLLPAWHGSCGEVLHFARGYASGGEPPRSYVLLLAFAELIEEGYLERGDVRSEIAQISAALEWKFPRAPETQLALARIAAYEEDWPAFAKALTSAAELGHRPSLRRVAEYTETGERGFPRDPGAARDYREELARAGDVEAMVALAWQLSGGGKAAADPQQAQQARVWFERAARAGDARGDAALGYAYGFGVLGVERDLERARHHLKRAHEAGLVEATFQLGQLHNRGAFGQRDPELATRLLQEAAEGQSTDAMIYLAECYARVSLKNSLYYYRQAHAHGDARALAPLRRLLRRHPTWRTDEDPAEVIDPTLRAAGLAPRAAEPEDSGGD